MSAILASIGSGLLNGVISGIGERYKRREERNALREYNSYIEKAASGMRNDAINTQLRNNQAAGGTLGYMAYRNKLSPEMLETFAQMYGNRISGGINASTQLNSQASQLLAQRKPMTSLGGNDFMAGFLKSLSVGMDTGLSTWGFLDELKSRQKKNNKDGVPGADLG